MLDKGSNITIFFAQIRMPCRNGQRDGWKSDSEIEALYGSIFQFSDWREYFIQIYCCSERLGNGTLCIEHILTGCLLLSYGYSIPNIE